MLRLAPLDVAATGLACGAASLGLLADSGPVLPLLGGLVVVAGALRARVALWIALLAIAPLLAYTGGTTYRTLTAAAICLGAAAAAFLAGGHRPAVGVAEDVRAALAIVLAVAFVGTAGALARFAALFV